MTQILVQTTGFDLTGALQSACDKACGKLLTRDSQVEKIEFFLQSEGKREGKVFTAKIKITRKGDDLFLEEKGPDMYQAIRSVCKKAKLAIDNEKQA